MDAIGASAEPGVPFRFLPVILLRSDLITNDFVTNDFYERPL